MASPDRELWLDVFDTPYSNNSANTVANVVFLSLICLSLVVCVAVAVAWRQRRFFAFTFVLGVACVFEIAAYTLRFQGWDFCTFSIQYGLATITPVFITIAIHLAAAEAIAILGTPHAPLAPAAHLRIFLCADIASLCLQAVGLSLTFAGARAAGPWGLLLPRRAHAGQTVLFAGLLAHAVALAAALAVLAATYLRAGRARGYAAAAATAAAAAAAATAPAPAVAPRARLFLAALPLAAASVLARGAYRAAAAWGGLGSPAARDPLLWLVAEGALLTQAMVALAAFHPALCLGGGGKRARGLEAGRPAMPPSSCRSDILVMAPSEAGSSEAGAPWSRRGSSSPRRGLAGVPLDADPYFRYEDPLASPTEAIPARGRRSPCTSRRFSEDIITAWAERGDDDDDDDDDDHVETDSFVQPPRKSSKRLSRLLQQQQQQQQQQQHAPAPAPPHPSLPSSSLSPEADALLLAAEAEDRVAEMGGDGAAESSSRLPLLSPPRKSSKRVASMPARIRSVRSAAADAAEKEEEDDDDDDERLEVASIVLPTRMPSKLSMGRRAQEDLDAVSLYSQ